MGALYGIFLGLRNETRGITAALFGFNLVAFGKLEIFAHGSSILIVMYLFCFLHHHQHVPRRFRSVPMFWFNAFLDADVDSYKSLKFAGVPNALCLSLLIWIAIFTMRNEEAELSLGKVISSVTVLAPIAGGGEPGSQTTDEF